MGHRILVVAHAHPDFSRGGGEAAAYRLFQGYRRHASIEEAWFLARVDFENGATGRLHLRRENEYLWEQAVHDFFNYATLHRPSLLDGFCNLIDALQPTIVHAHHFVHIGVDFIELLRTRYPHIRIVFTAHELTLICAHNGQMVKTGSLSLCNRWSPLDCHQCFPDRTPEAFWLRHERLKHFADCIDHVVTPSEFLRGRLVAWGLPADRIDVIENGLPLEKNPAPLEIEDRSRKRFGFFGQVNKYKGLDVLLAGAHRAVESGFDDFVLEVNGAYLERQEGALQDRIANLRTPLEKAGVLDWVGAYEPWELERRMRSIDWVVVPSIWWENSPVVIQEAFANGRPVVCSDIGGMAEKVRNRVDGVHVPARDARGWADAIRRLAGNDAEWERLRANIRPPITADACAQEHVALLDRVIASGPPVRLAG